MSLIRVSMGVLPTRRTKKSCSMTEEETVRSEGKRSSSFPNLFGWLGYWLLTYSSKAHWDFSCRPSTWATSDRPQASAEGRRGRERGKVRRSASSKHVRKVQLSDESRELQIYLLHLSLYRRIHVEKVMQGMSRTKKRGKENMR